MSQEIDPAIPKAPKVDKAQTTERSKQEEIDPAIPQPPKSEQESTGENKA